MERKWIGQLVVDFKHNNRYRRLGLEVPNFAISHGKKRLGAWSSTLRTLSISDHLIQKYTWDVVIEVLKHEMAHQYVTDVLDLDDAMAHGEEFQQACLIIGVHPDFRGAKGRTPKFLRAAGEETISPIMRKVEKLLALGASPNENEATRAMEKANNLIAEYNILIVENKSELVDYDYVQIVVGKKQVPLWKKSILSIISRYFFVRFIMITGYCAKNSEDLKIAELIGSHQNLAIAEHVYYFLKKQVVALWGTYQKEKKLPGNTKTLSCSVYWPVLIEKWKLQTRPFKKKSMVARKKS